MHLAWSYYISDGATYSVVTNLSITTSSAFATTKDALGNPYQTVVNVTGTRVYTYLVTGATLTSAIAGLSSALTPTPSQRFYPYSLLASAPGVYSMSSAPFVDGEGIGFTVSPSIPANGNAPGAGTLYSVASVRVAASAPTSTGVLTEAAYVTLPLLALQQQTYSLLA